MSNRYYFIIEFLPMQADSLLLTGRCLSALHGFMVTNASAANNIGAFFPKWNEKNPGGAIGFVSNDQACLTGLSFQPYFTLMQKERLFSIAPVIDVPTEAPEVRFIRNQTIDKSFLSSKKRRLRRGKMKAFIEGRDFTPVSREQRTFSPFHSIPMGSKSSGQNFALQVQVEEENETSDSGFNMYGLATNSKWRGTVPLISI